MAPPNSAWIAHVKQVQATKNLTYKDALKAASSSYRCSSACSSKRKTSAKYRGVEEATLEAAEKINAVVSVELSSASSVSPDALDEKCRMEIPKINDMDMEQLKKEIAKRTKPPKTASSKSALVKSLKGIVASGVAVGYDGEGLKCAYSDKRPNPKLTKDDVSRLLFVSSQIMAAETAYDRSTWLGWIKGKASDTKSFIKRLISLRNMSIMAVLIAVGAIVIASTFPPSAGLMVSSESGALVAMASSRAASFSTTMLHTIRTFLKQIAATIMSIVSSAKGSSSMAALTSGVQTLLVQCKTVLSSIYNSDSFASSKASTLEALSALQEKMKAWAADPSTVSEAAKAHNA